MYNPKLSPINIFNECSLYFSTHTTQFYVHGTMQVLLSLLSSNSTFGNSFYASEYRYT